MVDAHNVPPGLQTLLEIVVGNNWPTGDETALRTLATAWSDAGTALSKVEQEVGQAWQLIDQALAGASRTAVDSYFAALLGPTPDGSPAVLPTVVQCCDSAADALNGLANEIETLRIEVIGALVVLAIQLMVDLYFAWCGGEVAAEAEIVTTRVFFLMLLRKAVIAAVTRVAESVLAQVGFDLLAQVIELGQHHRGSIDWSEVETAAKNGAIGGAIGFGMGGLGKLMGKGLGKVGGDALGTLGNDGLGGALAKGLTSDLGKSVAKVGWNIGFSSITGMAEGAAQDAVDGSSGDYVSGAANGAFNGAMGSFHEHVNPNSKFSISPGDYLENKLNSLVDSKFPLDHGTGGTNGTTADAISLHTIESELNPNNNNGNEPGNGNSTGETSNNGSQQSVDTNDGSNASVITNDGNSGSVITNDGTSQIVDTTDGDDASIITTGGDSHSNDGNSQSGTITATTATNNGGDNQSAATNNGNQILSSTGGDDQHPTTTDGNNQTVATTSSDNPSINPAGGNNQSVSASDSNHIISTSSGNDQAVSSTSSSSVGGGVGGGGGTHSNNSNNASIDATGDNIQSISTPGGNGQNVSTISSDNQSLFNSIGSENQSVHANGVNHQIVNTEDSDDNSTGSGSGSDSDSNDDSDDDSSFDEGPPTLPEIDLGPPFDAAEIIAILNQRWDG